MEYYTAVKWDQQGPLAAAQRSLMAVVSEKRHENLTCEGLRPQITSVIRNQDQDYALWRE